MAKQKAETPKHNSYHVLSALEGILKYPALSGEDINAYLWRIGRTTPINTVFPFQIETINAALDAFEVIGQFLDKPSKEFVHLLNMEADLTHWLLQDCMLKGGAGLCVVIKGPLSGIVPRVGTWLNYMKGKKKKMFLTTLNSETVYMAVPLNSFI